MKQTVFGIILTMITVVILACNMTVSGRSVRQNELNQALNQAVEQTVEMLVEEKKESISNKELTADFIERLLIGIESDGDVQVDVIACDASKGILAVRAKVHYKHINGRTGTVSSNRTVILEQ